MHSTISPALDAFESSSFAWRGAFYTSPVWTPTLHARHRQHFPEDFKTALHAFLCVHYAYCTRPGASLTLEQEPLASLFRQLDPHLWRSIWSFVPKWWFLDTPGEPPHNLRTRDYKPCKCFALLENVSLLDVDAESKSRCADMVDEDMDLVRVVCLSLSLSLSLYVCVCVCVRVS